jgi:hypothetical protein
VGMREDLPGRWVDLGLSPAIGGSGLGPALGWLGGALAAGAPLWTWPSLGWLLLGLFLTTAVWGRLWARFGAEADPLLARSGAPGPPGDPPVALPYTEPGSLSATWGTILYRAWLRLGDSLRRYRAGLVEAVGLGGLLLVVAGLWGERPLLVAGAGLALLGLRRLVRGRPAALSLLGVLSGLAWPWWLGQAVWAELSGESVLLSVLWGLAYAGWAEARLPGAAGRPRFWAYLAQGGVLAFLVLTNRPVGGAILALALLGQVLVQAGLDRAGRRREIAGWTWPFAAVGVVLTGLVLGGWV